MQTQTAATVSLVIIDCNHTTIGSNSGTFLSVLSMGYDIGGARILGFASDDDNEPVMLCIGTS